MGKSKALQAIPDPGALRRTLVDEYGAIRDRLAAARSDIKREKELESLFRVWSAGQAPETSPRFSGSQYEVFLSPAGHQTRIASMAEVFRVMGKTRFLGLCRMALEHIESLGPDFLGSLTHKTQDGPRRITAVVQIRSEQAA